MANDDDTDPKRPVPAQGRKRITGVLPDADNSWGAAVNPYQPPPPPTIPWGAPTDPYQSSPSATSSWGGISECLSITAILGGISKCLSITITSYKFLGIIR